MSMRWVVIWATALFALVIMKSEHHKHHTARLCVTPEELQPYFGPMHQMPCKWWPYEADA